MSTQKKIFILSLACASFLALGILTAALGPSLANLANNTSSSLAAVGSIFTALFLGSLASQILAGPMLDRLGPRPILLVGLALIGAGTYGLTLVPWLWLALICTMIAGLGHGCIDVTSNVMAAELFPKRRATALNLLNVFYGIGAFLGPAIAGVALNTWGMALPSLWLGAGILILLLPPMALWAPANKINSGATQPTGSKLHLTSPVLALLGLLLLIYVGIENGIGGWTPLYLERTLKMVAANAALATSGFWFAITAGRVVATIVGTHLSARTILASSLGLAFLGSGLLAAGQGNLVMTIMGILLLGFGFGPIFPTTLALTTASFPMTPGTAASVAVAMGSLGGMLLPWIQGILLEKAGPTGSLALTLASTLGMLLLYFSYQNITQHSSCEAGTAITIPGNQSAS